MTKKIIKREYKSMTKVGDKIRIIYMSGEPHYTGRVGVVEVIDAIGQLHGTWGGLAVIDGEDEYEVVERAKA